MPDETDQTPLDRARAGDSGALEELLARHQAQIYRFGIKMCGDPEDARDVLQETLLAMARGVRDFRGASSMSTWLYTIARSFCIKKRRRSKFAPEAERSLDTDAATEAARLADHAESPEEALAGKQIEQAIGQALAALEPMYREVIVLRDMEGLTAPEVAEVLGVSVQAVKSRLHRARLSVRAYVAPLLGVPREAAVPVPGTCPDVVTLFSQHLEDEISPDVCAEMERHLAACGRCLNPFSRGRLSLGMEATMATVQVTEQNFEATVKQGIVLLDFWASWCGPCRAFAPVFDAAAERHPGVVFGKVDTDAEPGLAAGFRIRSIPTLTVLRDGVLLSAQPGAA